MSKSILEELNKQGQNIRKWYQLRLPSNPALDYYFMHRNTGNTNSVIVEYGFVDSTGDDPNQIKNNWQLYAEAVVKALANYAGIPYKITGGITIPGTYVVQKGDSLWSIAKKNNTSVEELKKLNNLSNNLLSVGQILKLPSDIETETGTAVIYTVVPGDSLYAIARKYGVTVDELKTINNLTSNNLSIGQQLIIPQSVSIITPNNQNQIYVVKSGDTLYSIASRYNTTVDEIKRLNNLTSNVLSTGQELLIPTSTTVQPSVQENEYVVQKGDNLYNIAQKYNTTVDELIKLNNLTSSILSVGQKLIVPEGDYEVYVVKSGDNLYDIARKFNTTVDAIKKLNGLSSNLLSIGQSLKIPN